MIFKRQKHLFTDSNNTIHILIIHRYMCISLMSIMISVMLLEVYLEETWVIEVIDAIF